MVSSFPDYTVNFLGAGWREGKEESHGPASQVAVFRRQGQVQVESAEEARTRPGSWQLVAREEWPVKRPETRSRDQVLGDELEYYLRQLTWDRRGEERVLVELAHLLTFQSVAKITVEVEEVARVLESRGHRVCRVEGVVEMAEQEKESEDDDWGGLDD